MKRRNELRGVLQGVLEVTAHDARVRERLDMHRLTKHSFEYGPHVLLDDIIDQKGKYLAGNPLADQYLREDAAPGVLSLQPCHAHLDRLVNQGFQFTRQDPGIPLRPFLLESSRFDHRDGDNHLEGLIELLPSKLDFALDRGTTPHLAARRRKVFRDLEAIILVVVVVHGRLGCCELRKQLATEAAGRRRI